MTIRRRIGRIQQSDSMEMKTPCPNCANLNQIPIRQLSYAAALQRLDYYRMNRMK